MNSACRILVAAMTLLPATAYGAPVPAQRVPPVRLAAADPAPALPDTAPRGIAVRQIRIDGIADDDRPLFEPLIAASAGRTFDRAELAALTAQIASLARDNGFLFATALIPRQDVIGGTLHVRVDMGRIDEIRLTGSQNPTVARILAPLRGKPGSQAEVERKLLLARDIPGITIAKPTFVREGERNILIVDVAQRRFAVSGSVDNYGTRSFGPLRARLGVQANSLLVAGDSVAFGVRTNPVDPAEIVQAYASVALPVGADGLQLGVAGSVGDNAPGEFGSLRLKGRSHYASAFASYPLVRSNRASLWLNAEAAYLALDRDFLDIAISKDTEVTFSLGLGSRIRAGKGVVRATMDVVRGVAVLGATRAGDPLASLSDGDAVFTKATAAVSFDLPLTPTLSLLASASGQVASRPLLAAQELSVGGAYSVRGYDFAETSGEDGAVGLVELRKDWARPAKGVDQVQAYAFVDGARVADLRSSYADTLASAGSGVRVRAGRIKAEAELAFPLTDARLSSGNRSPRLNVTLSFGF